MIFIKPIHLEKYQCVLCMNIYLDVFCSLFLMIHSLLFYFRVTLEVLQCLRLGHSFHICILVTEISLWWRHAHPFQRAVTSTSCVVVSQLRVKPYL